MRVENWAPAEVTVEIEKMAMDRIEKAAEIVASIARDLVPIGKPRPVYKKGQYAGKAWTARESQTLKDSIRVRRLSGDPFFNVRVYAGARQSDKLTAYYAHMVEYGSVHNITPRKPFLRPAMRLARDRIANIMENG